MSDNLTYTAKDGVNVLVFSAVCLVVSALALWLLASETVTCERGSDSRLRCHLSRGVAFITLHNRDLGAIQAVSLEEHHAPARTNERRGGTRYFVRYYTDTNWVDGSANNTRDECQAIVDGLQQLLTGRDGNEYAATLPGHWIARRVMPFVFLLGVVGSINGILILVRTRRSTASGESVIEAR